MIDVDRENITVEIMNEYLIRGIYDRRIINFRDSNKGGKKSY